MMFTIPPVPELARHVVDQLGGRLFGLHSFHNRHTSGEFDVRRPGPDRVPFGVTERNEGKESASTPAPWCARTRRAPQTVGRRRVP